MKFTKCEVADLRHLPPEVRRLVHAADRMRDRWADGDDQVKQDLWRGLHTATDAVWGRPRGWRRLAQAARHWLARPYR